jgi:hypothetical protein
MDKNGAWQREFAMPLRMFLKWLKGRQLCSGKVAKTITRLQKIAKNQRTYFVIGPSCDPLRLRPIHALSLPSNAVVEGLAIKSLQCKGYKTWAVNPAVPSAVQRELTKALIDNPLDPTHSVVQRSAKSLSLNFTDLVSMRQVVDEAYALTPGQPTGTLHLSEVALDRYVSSHEMHIKSRHPRLAVWALEINIPDAVNQNGMCIHECPIHRLSREQLQAITPCLQKVSHYLWLADTASFNPVIENKVFFSIFREGLKKKKPQRLAIDGVDGTSNYWGKTREQAAVAEQKSLGLWKQRDHKLVRGSEKRLL